MKKRKGNTIKVDMTDVEGSFKMEDGTYLCEVEEVEVKTSESSGEDYVKFVLKRKEGGGKLFTNCSLQPQALWKLRNMLEALGMEVPQKVLDVDLDELVGNELLAVVENETYQGKERPQVVDVLPADAEVEELEGEEDEDKPKKKGKKKDDEDEDEEEEEEKPSKKKKKAKDEDEEEEEEEEPEFEVGDRVKFSDDGTVYKGKVVKVDKKGGFCEVKSGDDSWEIETDELRKIG